MNLDWIAQICKDFFVAPVIIHISQCCHTFCSACIRTCFNQGSGSKIGQAGTGGVGGSQKCPICSTEAHEEKIKPIPALETAVANWQEARPQILKLISSLDNILNSASTEREDRDDDREQAPEASSSKGSTTTRACPAGTSAGTVSESQTRPPSSTNEPSTSGSRVTRSSQKRIEPTKASNEVSENAHASKKRKTSERASSKRVDSSDSDIEFVPGDPSNRQCNHLLLHYLPMNTKLT